MLNKNVLWFLGGLLAGVGYIFGVFYLILSRKDSSKWLGLMFLLGPFGSLILYIMFRNKDIATISLYLLYGFILWVPIALILGINPFYQIFGYVHGWLGI
ncbi:hypothetical protein [Saccharolobus caldissimus]|uniref:Uncharacterized protein n=1 Tax=Saccharolobus caldissimus TaxID=1702097 RepID=A0AAQ4CS89_9CREN|nr:hypothetical protein [Saccharolobus caldissimus]BDB98670.1 hypothetical protein SACC_16870 [Saccharolobus caldissimus]